MAHNVRHMILGTHRRVLSVVALAAFFLLPCAPVVSASATPTVVTLKEAVDIDQDAVRLSDIASFGGPATALLESLGETVVGRSPLPGQTRFVDTDYIRIRLKQAGHDTDGIVFRGADDVRITRKAGAIPTERIREAVEMAIRSQMPWRNEDVTIRDIRFDESVSLPTGRLSYRITPARNEDFLGQTILALHLFVDGEPVRKIWVNADISVMADVVVVARALGRNEPIETADLAVEHRDLADLPSDAVRRVDDVIGNRTTRMIYPGTVMQTGMITLPPLVKRGDVVKIVASSGPMTITATGMVKQQGAKGDLVRVVNTDSNRMITARVTGPGAVAVDF